MARDKIQVLSAVLSQEDKLPLVHSLSSHCSDFIELWRAIVLQHTCEFTEFDDIQHSISQEAYCLHEDIQ